MTEAELPKYVCHKEVHALQIDQVICRFNDLKQETKYALRPVDRNYNLITVNEQWIRKHNPAPGGYYVVYADGYASYSPKRSFEEDYKRSK